MIEYHTEISDHMTYDQAVMYCFALGDGWRLPTEEEYRSPEYDVVEDKLPDHADTWYEDDSDRYYKTLYKVIPVRDI